MVQRKVFLPLTQAMADDVAPPTVDSMRKRLGGRVEGGHVPFELGAIVEVAHAGSAPRPGVILASSGDRCDVFLERGLVKRTRRADLGTFSGSIPQALSTAAERATVFSKLSEGQPVVVERGEGHGTIGILREKCRYGALVEIAGGTLLGVGFQRLWPAPAGGSNES